MKTITEYRPLMFSLMAGRGVERQARRRHLLTNLVLSSAYGAAGFTLMLDTGCTAFEWQFWFMFGPLFAASELLLSICNLRVLPTVPPNTYEQRQTSSTATAQSESFCGEASGESPSRFPQNDETDRQSSTHHAQSSVAGNSSEHSRPTETPRQSRPGSL